MGGIGPVIPLDLEPLAALLRRPGIIGNDGDAAQGFEARRHRGCWDFHDALYAGDRQCILWVERFDLTAIDRAALDRGIFHARNDDVDAVGGPAAHDVIEVDDCAWFADVTPVLAVL